MEQILATAHRACLETFQVLHGITELQPDIPTYKELENQFDRYKVWADNVGAGHTGRKYEYSLDYRLREASFYRDQVAAFLDILRHHFMRAHEILENSSDHSKPPAPGRTSGLYTMLQGVEDVDELDDSPWVSSEEEETDDTIEKERLQSFLDDKPEIERILNSIQTTITGLYKLPIRQPAPMDRIKDRTTEETSLYQGHDILHVRSKFPQLNDKVATRLGKLITMRRQLLRYRKQHQERQKAGEIALRHETPLSETPKRSQAPSSIDPSKKSSNKYTGASKATTNRMDPLSPWTESGLYAPSETESNATLAASDATAEICIWIPPRPKGDSGESLTFFRCNYCSLDIQNVQSDSVWKRHVLKDLAPYACTFPDCELSDHAFDKRDDWYIHEMQKHRVDFFCNDHGHNPFTDQDAFFAHMKESHEMDLRESRNIQLMLQNFRLPTASSGGRCNLCGAMTASFKAHVSRHLEQIALFAIPREDYPSDDDDPQTRVEDTERSNASSSAIETSTKADEHLHQDLREKLEGNDESLNSIDIVPIPDSSVTGGVCKACADYTMCWITALPLELAAAVAMLDEEHETPHDFERPLTDKNNYVWGRMGEHNFIMASLPAGVYGTTSAAPTALSLMSSFPQVRFGLMVGIGAGIARPEEGYDIRLGDVVVSQPSGRSGGFIQYDLGNAQDSSHLNSSSKPPQVLLSALAKLKAQYMLQPSKVPQFLEKMLEDNPYMAAPHDGRPGYVHQGEQNDRLFEATYMHAGGPNCDRCDAQKEVKRDPRISSAPQIHYGVIASINSVVRDGVRRDSVLRDLGDNCICLEMEAAGLIDNFPCLLIRGISNYADSHMNDRWQRYAAATASAFAKEIISMFR